jgi:hypothetical protein
MKYIDLAPNPKSLFESMRDLGYSIETAIADIVDNSITADAKLIDIRFSWNNGLPWLAIIDSGTGMNEMELNTAMKLGSMSPLEYRAPEDLGRFGLGLKTASFSQCRCLTVVSKKNNIVIGAQWDYDKICSSENGQWPLCLLTESDINDFTELSLLKTEYLKKYKSGTIVFWQKIDRIYEGSSVVSKEAIFNETLNNVRSHLELVFHRFLSPEPGNLKIDIFFNKSPLEAFDPFNTKKSTELRKEEFRFENKRIFVQPYILPHHNKVSKTEWKKYEGKGYHHEQGFYVYRNRRLIISATWFRLIPKQELTKLLRVKVDIPNSLDHLWKIDVKKSNAFPPAGVRENLKRILTKIEFSGKQVYKQRGQRITSKIEIPAWERIAKDNQIFYAINKKHPLLEQLMDSLTYTQQSLLSHIIEMLQSSFPRDAFFSDVAANPEQVNTVALEREKIEELLSIFLGTSQEKPLKKQLREILTIDPFATNKSLTEEIFLERKYEY